jgi:hypothetical protein
MPTTQADRERWCRKKIDRALAYTNHAWLPSLENVLHGQDVDGVTCDTPDISFVSAQHQCGWWKPNLLNVGIPYMWGGFSSINEFDVGIADGLYAGNVPTVRTRQISKYCIGLDCSGFIAKCWDIGTKLSTHTIPEYSLPLSKMDQLVSADVLLLAGSHVMLFVEYADARKDTAHMIDISRRTGKVLESIVLLEDLEKEGYRPFRKKA